MSSHPLDANLSTMFVGSEELEMKTRDLTLWFLTRDQSAKQRNGTYVGLKIRQEQQETLNNRLEWTDKWLLCFNSSKCKVLHLCFNSSKCKASTAP